MTQQAGATMPSGAGRDGNNGLAISLGLLVLRLALATIFIYHGGQKIFGWAHGPGMHRFTGFIAMQHLPLLPASVWAWMAALAEFGGGCLTALGLLTRLAQIPLLVDMFVATWVVRANGFAGTAGHAGYQWHLPLMAIMTMLLLAGGGLVSVDRLIFRRGFWSYGPQPLA